MFTEPKTSITEEQEKAILDWLRFGEQMYREGKQKGYFSGYGWAAEQLRSLLPAQEQKHE